MENNYDKIEAAKNLLRSQGYHVMSRRGFKEGFIHLIRYQRKPSGIGYSLRLSKEGIRDHTFDETAEIAEINMTKLKWEKVKK